jgi:hypothetical protein
MLFGFGSRYILKRGGRAGEWFTLEKGHGKNAYKNNNIYVLKYFLCYIFGTKSMGIVVTIKRGSKWQTCKTLI